MSYNIYIYTLKLITFFTISFIIPRFSLQVKFSSCPSTQYTKIGNYGQGVVAYVAYGSLQIHDVVATTFLNSSKVMSKPTCCNQFS